RTDIFIWHRYTIPSYLAAAMLAGIGLQAILDRWTAADRRRWIALGVAAALPLVLLVDGWAAFDRSRYRLAEEFSRRVLDSLPPGAHLAASDDNVLFVLIYLHLVEGVRPDVQLILQGVGDADLPTLRFDPDDNPLFFTHHPNWNHPLIAAEPIGLTFRTVRRNASPQRLPQLPTALDGEFDSAVPKDYLTRNLLGHFRSMLGMTFERRDWPRARAEFVTAAQHAAENDVLFYNLGLIYRRNGMPRRALAAFERSVEINPRRLAAENSTRASDRVVDVRREVERLATLEAQLADDPRLAGFAEGSSPRLRALAEALDARGETRFAEGRRLLAAEVEAGRPLSLGVLDGDSRLAPPRPRRIAR
ncbi:MAG: tetratricopeptide repeat protein, partial [Acidobacteriota bacterium]